MFTTYLWFLLFQYIDNAGHHIYSERAELFNEIVISVCDSVDQIERTEIVQNGIDKDIKPVKESNDFGETLNWNFTSLILQELW